MTCVGWGALPGGVWKGHLLLLGSGSPMGIALAVLWDDCGLFSRDGSQVGFINVMFVGAIVTHLAVICDLWVRCWWWPASSCLSPASSSSVGGQASCELLLLLCDEVSFIPFYDRVRNLL